MIIKSFPHVFIAYLIVTLLFCNLSFALADTELPEGVAAGLPDKLSIMDSDGNLVSSSTGEYFFTVENMEPNEPYTKSISLMNLREDKAYHIYFYAEPVDKNGQIDLEEECTAVLYYEGETIYDGKVTGDGTTDLSKEPLDLGLFEPGSTRTLKCTITWNGTEAGGLVDNGSRIVDKNGTTVVREASGDSKIEGEVTFKWIFTAVLDEEYVPPKTGLGSDIDLLYISLIALLGVAITIIIFLIIEKKHKNKPSSKKKKHRKKHRNNSENQKL